MCKQVQTYWVYTNLRDEEAQRCRKPNSTKPQCEATSNGTNAALGVSRGLPAQTITPCGTCRHLIPLILLLPCDFAPPAPRTISVVACCVLFNKRKLILLKSTSLCHSSKELSPLVVLAVILWKRTITFGFWVDRLAALSGKTRQRNAGGSKTCLTFGCNFVG